MKNSRFVALILSFALCVQGLSGCSSVPTEEIVESDYSTFNESKIDEEFVEEESLDEILFEEEYISENLICEEGIYEYKINEEYEAEAICFEVVVSENIDEINAKLPDEIQDYDIDWPKVIGKFAVGTTIIVAAGVVRCKFKSTYYVVASPVEIGAKAVVGGAFAAGFEVCLNELKNADRGGLTKEGIKKYALEGFADGYMWAAISSVLKVTKDNLKRPNKLSLKDGTKLSISLDGTVKNAAGKELGKAYFAEKGFAYLVENSDDKVKAVKVFNSKGKQVFKEALKAAGKEFVDDKLPPNAILQLGDQICRTDANGKVFASGNNLLPNNTYQLGNGKYKTDSMGRIVEVTFDQLELKDPNVKRLKISSSIDDIGHGFQMPGDERGHIIGDRFKGNNGVGNMVPMSQDANGKYYKAIEDTWAAELKMGKNVSGNIKFDYSGDSYRPDSFKVVYNIGKEIVTKVISNL